MKIQSNCKDLKLKAHPIQTLLLATQAIGESPEELCVFGDRNTLSVMAYSCTQVMASRAQDML